ncbi:MAG TPA: hypothetical protein VKD72_03280, partial [Gemmataceae bacterium]|nr:hypothetical protein [Gemmataceae bacterium]
MKVVRWLAFVLCCMGTRVTAEPPPESLSPREALSRADKHYRAGELIEAERLYRRAFEDTSLHSRCCEPLLTVYARLGRLDRAVQVGLHYE